MPGAECLLRQAVGTEWSQSGREIMFAMGNKAARSGATQALGAQMLLLLLQMLDTELEELGLDPLGLGLMLAQSFLVPSSFPVDGYVYSVALCTSSI